MGINTDQRDALITILNSTEYFGPRHVDKTFRVIEQEPVTIVVGWRETDALPATFGATPVLQVNYVIALTCFVKDEGDPALMMDRLSDAIDIINCALLANPTLNDTCEKVTRVHATRKPGETRVIAGLTWIGFDVDVHTFGWLGPENP